MNLLIKSIVISTCLFSGSILAATNADPIAALRKEWLPSALNGMIFVNSKTGETLYRHNNDKFFTPASVTKLFTAAASLYQLGADYTYQTNLYRKGDDIFIQFTGDPSLTHQDLENLIHHLHPGSTIKGNIILDTSRFQKPDYPDGLSYEDLGWYYAAPVTSIIIDKNMVPYTVNSHLPFQKPAKLKVKDPEQAGILTLINRTKVVDYREADDCNLHLDLGSKNTLTLYGCIAQKKDPFTQQFAVLDPTIVAKQVIARALKTNKIKLTGNIVLGKRPKSATLLDSHHSKPLNELVSFMLQESDNTYANSFAKTLGYRVNGEGSFAQGVLAIQKILHQHAGIPTESIHLSDGAGHRFNLVTPNAVIQLLQAIKKDERLYQIMLQALPKSGVNGTLKDRLAQNGLKGRVIAKTGSMHDVAALAGFLKTANGKELIFVNISNHITNGLKDGQAFEEAVLVLFNQK